MNDKNMMELKPIPILKGKRKKSEAAQKRIYWFRRKYDAMVFSVDGEKAAWNIVEFQEFDRAFDYLGWSDGKVYKKTFSEVEENVSAKWQEKKQLEARLKEMDEERAQLRTESAKPSTDQDDRVRMTERVEDIGQEKLKAQEQANQLAREINDLRRDVSKTALQNELEAALSNPDKSPPRDFRKMNGKGDGVMDNDISGMIDKMPE